MAADLALLDLARRHGTAWLRLYRWDPHCLSFGRHEPAGRRYDRERIEELGLDTVRRPTGGRAVWHARELTYAVTAPLQRFGGMRQAYHRIHEMLAAALRSLGIPAELAPTRSVPSPAAGACFAAPVGGEVLVRGRKVVGSAQVRQANAFLQHGSLLLVDDQDLIRQLAGIGPRPDAGLPLGRPVTFEEAAGAIREAATCLGALVNDPVRVDPRAIEAHSGRFRSAEWTWAGPRREVRSPR